MVKKNRPRPVVLLILDGWGHREACENNAICQARTPVLDGLAKRCPHALIDASEHEVGLPAGQMGNSEVGHINLGAGRIVLQDLPRIDHALETGELSENSELEAFIAKLKSSGGRAHVMGLLSPGGVHSHQRHMAALANHLQHAGIEVAVHAFLDGRDTPPRSAEAYLRDFQVATSAPVQTISGRYYAMDRDKRWDRVALTYQALVEGIGVAATDPLAAIAQSYEDGKSDEFLLPSVVRGYSGMSDGDGLLMANFRSDRAREILTTLLDPQFDDFHRRRIVQFAAATGMVSYSQELDKVMTPLFQPNDLEDTLGEVIAAAGLKQLRIAETEKYAHVTFFFNGGRETELPGETRILVPSPKVATYDLEPEMSVVQVTDRMVQAIDEESFDLVVANFANGDMVGHTGKLDAAVIAVETVDSCIGRLIEALDKVGGCLVITADHGNAEQMTDPATGQAHTAHTMNPVPIYLVNGPPEVSQLDCGRLSDIAPTLLEIMGLAQPGAMTGRSLLCRDRAARGTAAE
ncbi:MAG: 2,3-bisphosphoglycerate-independent phosphoglycerate mutase [Pseudomonadota bacterium]